MPCQRQYEREFQYFRRLYRSHAEIQPGEVVVTPDSERSPQQKLKYQRGRHVNEPAFCHSFVVDHSDHNAGTNADSARHQLSLDIVVLDKPNLI